MNHKLFTLTNVILTSVLTTQLSLAQTTETSNELYKLCSKFPHNTKCKGIEVPIPLQERRGEKINCNFIFDPGEFKQAGKCKIIANKNGGITVYQEQGDKIEILEDKRNTTEINITPERIFASNFQVWNKISRWEVGFVPEDISESGNQTNFMVVFLNQDQVESLTDKIEALSLNKPAKVKEILAIFGNQSPNIQQLIVTKECQYCDLSNANLSEVDLEGANLQGANLQGANLQGGDLQAAYLLGANLSGADLTDADFRGVNLTFGSLAKATMVGTNFEGANLQQVDLQHGNLEKAKLKAPSFLYQANLSNANLTDANLRGANLQQANLQQANLEGADLGKIDIRLKNIPNNYTFGERLADQVTIINLLGVTSKGVDFFTNLQDANLKGANLSNTDLDRVLFDNANLTNVDFSESNLDESDLEQAKICGVTLADGSKSDRDCQEINN